MRYTPEIEQAIIRQVEQQPDRPIILPEWAYWEGVDQPWVYIDSMPVPLIRHLYESIVGAIDHRQGVKNPVGVDPRNVNPRLAVIVPTRRSHTACPNGHDYSEDDYIPGVGHRCQACHAATLLGTPSAADINRSKTKCPQGHKLVRRSNGKRRCYECPRAQTAAWRARRES